MSKSKKVINEQTEVLEADNDKTAAQASVHPNSHPANDTKSVSKVGLIASMIGAVAASKEDKTDLYKKMIEFQKTVGHGMGVGNNSSSNQATLNMKPSAASSAHSYGQSKDAMPGKGNQATDVSTGVREAIKQDVETMLAGQEGLSEEFRNEATVLFEAAVEARVAGIQLELEEAAEEAVEEQLEEITNELVEGLDNYLDYVAAEWMTENQVAIESTLRNEMTQEFIAGLRNLFVEHNFDIPEEQVEVVDALASKNEELESRLAEAISQNAELATEVAEYQKTEVIGKLSEGLTLSESEKLKELASNVDAADVEQFVQKVTVIKESNFVKGVKKSTINESLEEVSDENKQTEEKKLEPSMNRYASAISRTLRNY